jgi:fermentation-respiration switch protein FrsA (DUF1100 family)
MNGHHRWPRFLLSASAYVLTTPLRNPLIGKPRDLPYRDIALTTADNVEISAWYVPGTRPDAVVLVHGIYDNRRLLLPQARFLSRAGYHLVLLDLRGHGRSGGHTVTYGYREALDVREAVDYVLDLPTVERVAAIGHSLGGAAIVRAAAEDPRIEALVVQSSYSSLSQAMSDALHRVSFLSRSPFAPLVVKTAEERVGLEIGMVNSAQDLATMSPRPVLIIHSDADNLLPLRHAEDLYEAAAGPKELWVVHGLPHTNAIWGNRKQYERRVLSFLEAAFAGPD